MEAGELISGKYRLQRVLGAGSMGSVWSARNELTNRDFAVKFLLPELSENQEAINRFFLEARACGQIRHPAIVDVYDMGQAENGAPYLVMELLEGEGFDQRITRQGYLRPADVCRYLCTVARGLAEAHARGLIHRDLKPGNVFFAIDKAGEIHPKVLDFGISKETSSEQYDFVRTSAGTVLGSPAYMSPEQARGETDVDARADLWALGVIMYEALTGEVPFDAANYNALMLCILSEPHKPIIESAPEVPQAMSDLVDRLLEKDRNNRISSANALADELEKIYSTLTITPLHQPERQVSIVPPLIATTQSSWLSGGHSNTTSGSKRAALPLLLIASLTVAIAAGGAWMLSEANQVAVPRVSRMSSLVQALVTRAHLQATKYNAAAKARADQKAVNAANKRADDIEKTAKQREKRKKRKRKSVPGGPKPHGGVMGPGF
jgi:eukaryotic-like serine/threonine-protein kinase